MRTNFSIIFTFLVIALLSFGCRVKTRSNENLQSFAFRLKPGEDLQEGIASYCNQNNIKAGWVSTCVGSLTNYNIRFANQPSTSSGTGHFEIVSLTGTISDNGMHMHLSISDSLGKTIGGHLMPGCKIYTTAEIVLLSTDKYKFTRENDGTTPWDEFQVKRKH